MRHIIMFLLVIAQAAAFVNTCDTALTLTGTGTGTLYADNYEYRNWWKFNAPSSGIYTFNLDVPAGVDIDLFTVNSCTAPGDWACQSIGLAGADESCSVQLSQGWHYIDVYGMSHTIPARPTGAPYTLSVNSGGNLGPRITTDISNVPSSLSPNTEYTPRITVNNLGQDLPYVGAHFRLRNDMFDIIDYEGAGTTTAQYYTDAEGRYEFVEWYDHGINGLTSGTSKTYWVKIRTIGTGAALLYHRAWARDETNAIVDRDPDDILDTSKSATAYETNTFHTIIGSGAICGNGIVEGGEQCDGNSETQRCGPATDLGVCQYGTQRRSCTSFCTWSGWGSCQGAIWDSPETCNALDDDCDGLIDDGVCPENQPRMKIYSADIPYEKQYPYPTFEPPNLPFGDVINLTFAVENTGPDADAVETVFAVNNGELEIVDYQNRADTAAATGTSNGLSYVKFTDNDGQAGGTKGTYWIRVKRIVPNEGSFNWLRSIYFRTWGTNSHGTYKYPQRACDVCPTGPWGEPADIFNVRDTEHLLFQQDFNFTVSPIVRADSKIVILSKPMNFELLGARSIVKRLKVRNSASQLVEPISQLENDKFLLSYYSTSSFITPGAPQNFILTISELTYMPSPNFNYTLTRNFNQPMSISYYPDPLPTLGTGQRLIKWLYGDLHTHTSLSIHESVINHVNGAPPLLHAKAADEAGLDFVAITDHAPDLHILKTLRKPALSKLRNDCNSADSAAFQCIPGVEYGTLQVGRSQRHFLAVGELTDEQLENWAECSALSYADIVWSSSGCLALIPETVSVVGLVLAGVSAYHCYSAITETAHCIPTLTTSVPCNALGTMGNNEPSMFGAVAHPYYPKYGWSADSSPTSSSNIRMCEPEKMPAVELLNDDAELTDPNYNLKAVRNMETPERDSWEEYLLYTLQNGDPDEGFSVGIGTSDAHDISKLGAARTYVFVGTLFNPTPTQNDIIESLRKGRAIVTNGPLVNLWVSDIEGDLYIPMTVGDVGYVSRNDILTLQIEWNSTAEFGPVTQIEVFKNGTSFANLTPNSLSGSTTLTDTVTSSSYYRLEARTASRRAYTNPVWMMTGIIATDINVTSLLINQPASLSTSIRNNEPSTQTATVRFYETSTGQLLSEQTRTISANGSETLTSNWTPSRSGPQTVSVEVLGNDVTSSSFTVSSNQPDISIDANGIVITQASDNSIDINALIANLEWAPASNVTVALYDGDPDGGGGILGTQQVSLGPSDSANLTFTISLGGREPLLFIVADPDNLISETNETNNKASRLASTSPSLELPITTGLQMLSLAAPLPQSTCSLNVKMGYGLTPLCEAAQGDFFNPPVISPIIFHWNGQAYEQLDISQDTQLEPGKAYWLQSSSDVQLILQSPSRNAKVPLSAGWNQIGIPHGKALSACSIRVKKGNESKPLCEAAQGDFFNPPWVAPSAFVWGGDSYQSLDLSTNPAFTPGRGYWIKAEEVMTLEYN